MQNDKLKNYLHLHFIVFIWGFTAVLGALITLEAFSLVWYRMLLAVLVIGVYIVFKKFPIAVSRKTLWLLLATGVIIALHWVTFFMAIKVSNVSITLATLSTGAFFTSLLEPFFYKRKIIWYEVFFGLLVIIGLSIIFSVKGNYTAGILLSLISAILAACFALINGKLVKQERPSVIAFYEMGAGVLFLSMYVLFADGFNAQFFKLSSADWLYLFLLASVCTAYAFIASVKVMRHISPYSVMLTTNLEPVYGILLAYFILGDAEKMETNFYIGGAIILITVIANGILKTRDARK